ncbi:MAG TPA: hypothetical protein VLV32_09540 [Burkholderiales bacterium]|nr:hypothetical protein [Burkholderiales bacterium]
MSLQQRTLKAVPRSITLVLIAGLALQLAWQYHQPRPTANAEALAFPPEGKTLLALSLGEPIAFSQLMTLYLQAFDNQPGISIPFRDLDYDRVQAWLSRILELDPVGQYPLLMASHIYGQVSDTAKQRKMFEFVYQEFFKDPDRRWPWLAHAAIMAKHRLKDLPLALRYAQAIRKYATGPDVPHWATQMPIFILEDMGELQSAKILLGGLLVSGIVTDPHEIHLLTERLQQLENEEKSSAVPKN